MFGSHFNPWSKTILAILMEGHTRNISGKLFWNQAICVGGDVWRNGWRIDQSGRTDSGHIPITIAHLEHFVLRWAKKVGRRAKGVPEPYTAAYCRYQEKKTKKKMQKTNKQKKKNPHGNHKDNSNPSPLKWDDSNAKKTRKEIRTKSTRRPQNTMRSVAQTIKLNESNVETIKLNESYDQHRNHCPRPVSSIYYRDWKICFTCKKNYMSESMIPESTDAPTKKLHWSQW